MYDIIGKRYYYFAFSLLIIIPGIIAMIYSTMTFGTPVRLGIDFTGGSSWELRLERPADLPEVRSIFASHGMADAAVQNTGDNRTILVRTKPVTPEIRTAVEQELSSKFGTVTELQFDSVGPAIGREVTNSATIAVVAASVLILLFIYYAFRRVPNSFRYGVCAIVAMTHDVFVSFGIFSILGLAFGWEADSLFLTALLTMVGFSVHDTIVVFDRIRENVPKHRGESYETVVNRSVLETLHRSVVTQLTVVFVLVTMLLFGGGTISHFVTVLLYSMFSAMYSSIFNASPMLVVWQNGEIGKFFRRVFGGGTARAAA
jgi:preprotein translocase subunit SecF